MRVASGCVTIDLRPWDNTEWTSFHWRLKRPKISCYSTAWVRINVFDCSKIFCLPKSILYTYCIHGLVLNRIKTIYSNIMRLSQYLFFYFIGAIIFGSDQEVREVMRAVRRNNATGAFSWIGSDGWSARNLVSDGNEPEVRYKLLLFT